MKIGIVAATIFEIQPFLTKLQQANYKLAEHTIDTVTTGVGLMSATYSIQHFLQHTKPDLVIQAGIGGTFSPQFQPGDLALIKRELVADQGVVEDGEYRDLADLGFLSKNDFPYSNGWLVNPHTEITANTELRPATGVTVNEITTSATRMEQLTRKYGCEIESMEGAALHYVCLRESVPFLQLRAISNRVGERDKKKWMIGPAIEHLNTCLLALIERIS